MNTPTIEQMQKDLLRGGWDKVNSTTWRSPWGALYRGPALAWKIWNGSETTEK